MMRLKLILLCCLGLPITQAVAEEAIVIDAQSLGGQSANMPAGSAPQAPEVQPADSQATGAPTATSQAPDEAGAAQPENGAPGNTAAQAEAIKERIPKDKMSPRQRQAMARMEAADENKKTGESFLAENKAKPGVVTLPSGVQYKILRAGQGKKPAANSMIVCRYRGTLVDGTVFESTDPKKPMNFYVSTFLPGLQEAVMLMPAGSKWQIIVPPQLGYRELGNRLVGPNATLIYEMELLSIK
ncbi:MAG TPA: FKBP-type peptidyl-prolyl cis-trans isomerase [Gallionella sp.]|nr:FKBP-type peptidyl-prolyl cis-trans isomerase [Gallionella sp.]